MHPSMVGCPIMDMMWWLVMGDYLTHLLLLKGGGGGG